jgi:hypothetical protein
MPKSINPAQRRSAWRQEEQRLVERWNEAMARYRAIQQELSTRAPAQGGAAPEGEIAQKARAALAEIEALRRQVARLKREFLSGERY